jgi:hypothetical protein
MRSKFSAAISAVSFAMMVFFLTLIPNSQASTIEIQKRPVEIYNTYIANGFDNNDAITVTVSGALPNTCYFSPHTEVVNLNGEVRVMVFAYYDENRANKCLQMKVPFLVDAQLGILESGDYAIVAQSGYTVLGTKKLNVAKSQGPAGDGYLYANVQFVEDNDWDRTLKMSGVNPSDCFELDRVEVYSNGVDTYSILPILKKVKEECLPIPTRFSYEVEIPLTLKREKVLLHIRVMNGQSLTFLY